MSFWQQRYQERQRQFWKIQSALAAFENTRITLLIFKGQFIVKGSDELDEFLRRSCIDLEKNLQPLSSDQLDNWEALITSTTNTILQFFEKQTFYTASFSEKLAFIAEQKPKNLIFFHKAYEALNQVNHMIDNRNQELIKYRTSSEEKGLKASRFIDTYRNILSGLTTLIEDALAFHSNSASRLVEYAKENYCVKNDRIFQKRFPTNYENLMPTEDYLKGWDDIFKD